MLKVLIFVFVLVVPIFGEINKVGEKKLDNEGETKPAIEVDDKKLALVEAWKQKCKNVSGVDIDIGKHGRLYEDLRACRKYSMDTIQMRREINYSLMNFTSGYNSNVTLSDLNIYHMVTASLKYCPKYPDYLNCRDALFPIYMECYTRREINGFGVRDEIFYRINDFFCNNNAENIYHFLTAKIVDCTFAKETEFVACFQQYLHLLAKKDDDSLIHLYKPDIVCNAVESLKACSLPLYEQCELSPTAGELFKKLYAFVDTESVCAHYINKNG